MKTLYLHIGTPKTATSSIQRFLMLNHKLLQSHGFCFPKSPIEYPHVVAGRNAHFMIGKLYTEDEIRDFEAERAVFADGMEQLHSSLKEYDNVILSDESLWRASSYVKKNLFSDLKKDAEDHNYEIKIIVYLRRQDQFLISRWNQCIKSALADTRTLPQQMKTILHKEKDMLDYAGKLDKIAEIFGKQNIIVRRFEPAFWPDESIILDFLNCIGLPVDLEYKFPQKMINPGLKGNTVEIKRIINKDLSFSPDETAYLGDILRNLSEESGNLYPCSMLSAQETRDLLAQFQEGNKRIAEEYIGDGKPLFSDDIPDVPKWVPDNPYMVEDLIRFFSAVSIELHRENEQLRKELENTKNNLQQFKKKIKHPFHTIGKRILHTKS